MLDISETVSTALTYHLTGRATPGIGSAASNTRAAATDCACGTLHVDRLRAVCGANPHDRVRDALAFVSRAGRDTASVAAFLARPAHERFPSVPLANLANVVLQAFDLAEVAAAGRAIKAFGARASYAHLARRALERGPLAAAVTDLSDLR